MSDHVDLIPVRRRDLLHLRRTGSPLQLPNRQGRHEDPRYPSPTSVRQVLSFVIDLVVHLGVPIAAAYALDTRGPGLTGGQFLLICAGGFVALSILDRIFVQWATQATVGKAVTALRMVRDDTGGRPTLWMLTKAWLIGVFGVIASGF